MDHKNAVLIGLEKMLEYDGHGDGLAFDRNGVTKTVSEMIDEIKNDTELGRDFSINVYATILAYFSKFSQDTE